MKVESLEFYPIAIDRHETFKIATGSSLTAENVLVKVEGEGKTGWGNACPNSVTQETTESIIRALKIMKERVEGKDVDIQENWETWRKELPEDRAALAGLDIALWDLKGKMEDKKIFEMFDGIEDGVLTDRTIGIMSKEDTVEHAEEYLGQGFQALKIKIGLDLLEDIKRISAVRDTVGPDIKIWIDANQGYSVQEAITICKKIEPMDISFVEQPVRENDLEGMKEVTDNSSVPIMADESMKDHETAEKICSEGMADMVNIKLMKCGGITGGRKIVDVIEKYDTEAMVGCMGETIPSIAGSTHLHLSSENIRYADQDSQFMLSDNVATGLAFENGRLHVSDGPGLGIRVDEEKIEKYLMDLE